MAACPDCDKRIVNPEICKAMGYDDPQVLEDLPPMREGYPPGAPALAGNKTVDVLTEFTARYGQMNMGEIMVRLPAAEDMVERLTKALANLRRNLNYTGRKLDFYGDALEDIALGHRKMSTLEMSRRAKRAQVEGLKAAIESGDE